MISQPQVESLKYAGTRTMYSPAAIWARSDVRTAAVTPLPARIKNKTRRGSPAELGRISEGYLFIHESRFTVQKSQVVFRRVAILVNRTQLVKRSAKFLARRKRTGLSPSARDLKWASPHRIFAASALRRASTKRLPLVSTTR
jgi:hypothetical protein